MTRAHHPRPGTPPFSRCPACTVLGHEAWPTLIHRVLIPAILAVLVAAGMLWRGGARRASRPHGRAPEPGDTGYRARPWVVLLGLGGAGLAWWLGVGVETQAGFAGNPRYLQPGTALVAIAGGVAWGLIAIGVARALLQLNRSAIVVWPAGTLLAAGALVLAPPWIGRSVIDVPQVGRQLAYQADLRTDLSAAIGRSGGARRLLRCGSVLAEDYQVPMAAWMLGVPISRVLPPPAASAPSPAPNVILQVRPDPGAPRLPAAVQMRAWEHDGARYTLLSHVRTFSVFSTCPHKVGG